MKRKKIQQIEQAFLNEVKVMNQYGEAIALLYWDLRTKAPRKGMPLRHETIGMLTTESQKRLLSKQMKEYLSILSDKEAKAHLKPVTRLAVKEVKKQYKQFKKIPMEEYEAYVVCATEGESVWEEAKNEQNFEKLQPYLEKLVDYKKRFASYWGYEKQPYNGLLDLYEPGMTVEVLDQLFAKLKERIVPLVKAVKESPNQPNIDALKVTIPREKQEALCVKFLEEMGYDFEAGRMDDTLHPFETSINRYDVRITNRYDEEDFRTAIFGAMHEGGHALYEQHISPDLLRTPLCEGASMGIHESQSLFFENFIGRSEPFLRRHYGAFTKANESLASLSPRDFYCAVNESKPSLIRIEADELTYPLHIMIRYEIEKALFNGDLTVKELPGVWNQYYEEYLGIRPEHDGVGVMQDVHWAGGDFGYFPSYALGYMYAAQFRFAMERDLSFNELVESGNLKPIVQWLTERIHTFGKSKQPLELVLKATGEALNVDYLIRYLEEKYKDIYHI